MASFPPISQFCDPHGNGYMPPQKLTARLVVASSEMEAAGRRRERGKMGSEEPGEVET